ncbi:MAG: heme biosynthesis protein HemY [Candidatus Liberibacter europaeus]|uniref:Heme biosynthesis protein HemY n=1 Tax=Candidatus Liberibacter europaeus TaxID=744859 RepID=A0A2T4VWA3_9HYPH|nr:heme biosynthesis protein HemY [Candidatus Liberibacter europaeus]PTL86064.1 MAG: heme biosynthesis protein HemY [Candidatus Liberibacter europaeus]
MIRFICYICLILFVIYSFINVYYFSSRDISIILGNHVYQTSSIMALSLIYVLLLAVILIISVLRFFFSCPSILMKIFHKYSHNKKYSALSTGLIALAAQDIVLARKMSSAVSNKISPDNESLIHLLESQIALADEQHFTAREKFETMLKIPETQELALYGLYHDSCRIGDLKSAKYYAEKAMKISPNLSWCSEAILQYYVSVKEWSNAINFLNHQKNNGCIKQYNSKKSILLIARSLENLSVDNASYAYKDAIESLKLCNDSIISSIVAAKALILKNKKGKAEAILEQMWTINPHPDIAHIYTTVLSKNPSERLKRALKLENLNKNNVESLIIVAKAALEEGNANQAHKKAMLAIEQEPRKKIFLILAEIAQTTSDDLESVIYWTQKALYAKPDPIWISEDGYLSEKWLPVSPISNKLCCFFWKIPTNSPEYISYQRSFKSSSNSEDYATDLQLFKQKAIKKPKPKFNNNPIDHNGNNASIREINALRQPDDPGVKIQSLEK